MPRQSNGTYQAPGSTAAVSGQTISSSAYNTLTGDLGNEITNSLDRLGRAGMEANLSMGGFNINNVATAVVSTDAPNLTQMQTADATVLSTAQAEIAAAQTAVLGSIAAVAPTGRLTLTTLTPILLATVAGAIAILYTPANSNSIPVWNGTLFSNFPFSELSNTLANSSVGNAGPLAAQPNSVYDLFVWQAPTTYTGNTTLGSTSLTSMSSITGIAPGQPVTGAGIPAGSTVVSATGTTVVFGPLPATATATTENITFYANTLTRGDMWSKTATVTIPTASPAVVNLTAHGLLAGCPVRFSAATLPTGLTAGVTYFVIAAGLTANAFEISASVGGSAINVTGAGSGAITVQAGTGGFGVSNGALGTESRGTAQALSLVQGFEVNTNSITNGPPAGYGVWVGTMMTDGAAATCTFNPGFAQALGGPGSVGFWNAYNQEPLLGVSQDTGAGHGYAASAFQQGGGPSATTKITYVVGAKGRLHASYSTAYSVSVTNSAVSAGVGLDSSTVAPAGMEWGLGRLSNGFGNTKAELGMSAGPLGAHTIFAMEIGDGSSGGTLNINANALLLADLIY